MPIEILVNEAATFDAALIASIHATCFARAWDEAAMATFITGPGTLCLVGFAGDSAPVPAGILIARRAADEAELLTLAVAPACRRMGVARALLAKVATDLRASGVKRLFLEVDEGNAAALALYRSVGAAPVGRRRAYYESGADAAIFSLALSGPPSDDGASRR